MSQPAQSSPFTHFAAACDAARATPSKLAKTAAIADYLKTLSPPDLPIATRFLAAHPFSPSSGKTLTLGGALVVETLHTLAHIDRPTLNAAFREHGEIGEALSALWPNPPADALPLTLLDIQSTFLDISNTGNQDTKRHLLTTLLRRTSPREAVYLVKIVLGDMRTGVSEGVIEMALAQAFSLKLPALRKARLLVGDLDAVAQLAAANALDQAAFRPFIPLGYMLAQPIMTADEILTALDRRPAIAEDKYDGIRAQLHASIDSNNNPRIELFSRGSGAVTHSFPDITAPALAFLTATKHSFVLDGEIVPMRILKDLSLETLPFSTLQKRLGRKSLTPKQLRENPCTFLAFDLLYLNGTLLLDTPLEQRRQKLEHLFTQANELAASPRRPLAASVPPLPPLPFALGPTERITTAPALAAAFAAARLRRNEGLVIKRLDSLYTPGRRGDAWLKLKSHLPTLDVVVVAAERGHGKRRHVLSDVTFAVQHPTPAGPQLLTLGKAYTGLTDAEIAHLTDRFIAETVEERGRTRIVRPSLVLEIAFDQINKSDRHNSGYALRFPRIVRIRPDKTPADIDTLARVQQIYASPDNLAVLLDAEQTPKGPPDPGQLSLF